MDAAQASGRAAIDGAFYPPTDGFGKPPSCSPSRRGASAGAVALRVD